MNDLKLHTDLGALERTRGGELRDLRLGDRVLRFSGLDRPLAEELDRRWGCFLGPAGRAAPQFNLRVLDGGAQGWLEQREADEPYRIESINDAERRVVVSYHFALRGAGRPGAWRVAVVESPHEPTARIVENATRYLAARIALELGGFAMHAAAVEHDGRAFIFAGPSGSGKSTLVGLAAPGRSLGDDYSLVVPLDGGWAAPALPFDNSEKIVGERPAGWIPVAGIWRLYKAERTWIDVPPAGLAAASLLACNALPWTFPEAAGLLMDHARKFVAEGRFEHLHFTRQVDLWTELLR